MQVRTHSLRSRLLVLLLALGAAEAAGAAPPPSSSPAGDPVLPERQAAPSHVPGQFIIKFRDDADLGAVAEELVSRRIRFEDVTGRAGLDDLNQRFRVQSMRRLLRRPRGAGLQPLKGGITKSRALARRLALRESFEERLDALAARPRLPGRRTVRRQDVPYLEHLYLVEIGDATADIEVVCALYARDPDVEYAEPNHVLDTDFVPNDAYYAAQWSHQLTQAEAGWNVELGDPGVVIAIVDTGVDYDHVDLAANMLGDCTGGCPIGTGYDFVDTTSPNCADADCTTPDDDPSDDAGHGTHVAGISAGVGNNGAGIIGACPGCSIMPVRAGYRKSTGGSSLEIDDIANALTYAADNGASVINMSFGSSFGTSTIADAIDYAHALGVLTVASAGNDSTNTYRYPAAFDEVIAVAATDESDSLASFSNHGSWVDVAAPGDSIYSTDVGGYSYKSGTSMSAPYVGGLAGLVISQNPTWTNEQVRAAIRASADRVVTDGFGFGYGRVNVAAALAIQDPIRVSIDTPVAEQVIQDATSVFVFATVDGPASSWVLDYGEGYDPSTFGTLAQGSGPALPLGFISNPAYGVYTVRLRAYNANGDLFEDRNLFVNQAPPPPVQSGWPRTVGVAGLVTSPPTVVDLDGDGTSEIVVHTLPCEVYVFDHLGSTLAGWPQPSSGDDNCQSAPAVGDVDGDGDPEIFVRSSYDADGLNRVDGFHGDATPLAGWPRDASNLFGYPRVSVSLGEVDGDPAPEILYDALYDLHIRDHDGTSLPGWPQPAGYSTTPHLADLDGDGSLEILSTRYLGHLFAHRNDGSLVFSEHLDTRGRDVGDLVIADLDRDGSPEIAVALSILVSTSPRDTDILVFVTDAQGNVLPGWPQQYDSIAAGLSVGNLDADASPELVVVSGSSVYVYDRDGSLVPGWPQPLQTTSYAEAAIGDIDGDGENDVVVTAGNQLYAWGRDGTLLDESGFPVVIHAQTAWTPRAPAIGDIDADGDVDIVTTGISAATAATISVLDLPAPYDPTRVDWPMDQHDPMNSGAFPTQSINAGPLADAGTDATAYEEDPVGLDGSGSTDPDGAIASYAWSQIAGPAVALAGADTATPGFSAPRVIGDTPLVFELTVTDEDGASDAAQTTVTVQIVDTDADGLSDLWETQYFGDLTQGPDDDPDADGQTNRVEFERQNDPTLSDAPKVPALGPAAVALLAGWLGLVAHRRLRPRGEASTG